MSREARDVLRSSNPATLEKCCVAMFHDVRRRSPPKQSRRRATNRRGFKYALSSGVGPQWQAWHGMTKVTTFGKVNLSAWQVLQCSPSTAALYHAIKQQKTMHFPHCRSGRDMYPRELSRILQQGSTVALVIQMVTKWIFRYFTWISYESRQKPMLLPLLPSRLLHHTME